jgi:hypothetical protein
MNLVTSREQIVGTWPEILEQPCSKRFFLVNLVASCDKTTFASRNEIEQTLNKQIRIDWIIWDFIVFAFLPRAGNVPIQHELQGLS